MADFIDKTQEDRLREKARKLIAANQPAAQVAHLLSEDGVSETLAVDIAYNAKIVSLVPRQQRAFWGIIGGAILLLVGISAMGSYPTFYYGQYAIWTGLTVSAGAIGEYLYCRHQIRLAKNRLRTLGSVPLAS